jgi:hypothetical protein
MPDGFPTTPILDQLLLEARTGGIRPARHCQDELAANPGEVHPCAQRDPAHRGDHVSADGHLTW